MMMMMKRGEFVVVDGEKHSRSPPSLPVFIRDCAPEEEGEMRITIDYGRRTDISINS
jgi:hypothetical protein